jgi:hypothetical protein
MSRRKANADLPNELLRQVAEKLRNRLTDIVAITDCFCEGHLDDEFKGLCGDVAAALCVEGLPLGKGKAAGWAAGIV